MKKVLILVLIFSSLNVFGQQEVDSTELKIFWKRNIIPLIKKEKNNLEKTIEFPLKGDWGYIMNLKKQEINWDKNDFFKNYEKLFTQKVISNLTRQDYKDLEIYKENNEMELLLNIEQEKEEFESGIILRFKKIQNHWKLYLIQKVGSE